MIQQGRFTCRGSGGPKGWVDMTKQARAYDACMGLIIGLLVIWIVLSIIGFAVKGMIWLAIIGLILFVATGIWGWVKRKANA